ncbi:MAG: hypothetical protein ACC657_17530, partial [Thiohalomonadales bacterium]
MQGLLKVPFSHNYFNQSLKKTSKLLLLVGISFKLMACGGGGGGPIPVAPEPVGKVSGVGFIGVIEFGTVNIYNFSGEERGASIASGDLAIKDGQGFYSIALKTTSKPIQVCLTDAKYREITSLKLIDFKQQQELCAVEYYESGSNTTVTLTFYSHIATGLATRLVNFLGFDPDDAISKANQEIYKWVNYDINKTTPVNLKVPISPLPTDVFSQHRAGFANAAISVYSGWVNGIGGLGPSAPTRFDNYNSILFAQRAYQDILVDGVLDGNMGTGKAGLGAVAMTTKIYRHDVALDMLVMANNGNNQSGIDLKNPIFRDILFADAARFSEFDFPGNVNNVSTFNIFGAVGGAGGVLKNTTPIMNNFIVPKVIVNNPDIIGGGVKFAASITDIVNQLDSVEYHIITYTNDVARTKVADDTFKTFFSTDTVTGQKIDLTRTVAEFKNIKTGNVFKYPDGTNYDLRIIANYTILNPTPGNPTTGIARITKPMTIGNIGTQIKALTPRSSKVPVPAQPVPGDITFVSGVFNMHAGVSNPLKVDTAELTIDDVPAIAASNFLAGIYNVPIFRVDTTSLTDGSHNFQITASNSLNQSASISASYFVDNTSPTVNITAPLTPASGWFTTDFNINVATSDAGSGMNNFKILVDGIVKDTLSAPTASADRPIVLSSLADGAHTIRVQATDNVGLTSFAANPVSVNTDKTKPTLIVSTPQSVTYTLPSSSCSISVTAADSASG